MYSLTDWFQLTGLRTASTFKKKKKTQVQFYQNVSFYCTEYIFLLDRPCLNEKLFLS